MNVVTNISHPAKELIAKDELSMAMKLITERAKRCGKEYYNIAVSLSQELHSFRKDAIKGIYNQEQSRIAENGLVKRMVDLIDLMEEY